MCCRQAFHKALQGREGGQQHGGGCGWAPGSSSRAAQPPERLIQNLNLKIHNFRVSRGGLLLLTVFRTWYEVRYLGVTSLVWLYTRRWKAQGESALSALGRVVNFIIAEPLTKLKQPSVWWPDLSPCEWLVGVHVACGHSPVASQLFSSVLFFPCCFHLTTRHLISSPLWCCLFQNVLLLASSFKP